MSEDVILNFGRVAFPYTSADMLEAGASYSGADETCEQAMRALEGLKKFLDAHRDGSFISANPVEKSLGEKRESESSEGKGLE